MVCCPPFSISSASANESLAVLKKPLQTSIAVEVDEFDDIDVEDKLHIVISVKDFRAIIQHAGITGNEISARYSIPAKPIQLAYSSDAISCEFLIMTVGERGSNPNQKTKKGRKGAAQDSGPRLEAASRRESVAPIEGQAEAAQAQPQRPQGPTPQQSGAMRPPATNATSHIGAPRASASRIGAFDLRPSQHSAQRPPAPTMGSQSLFVDDEGWEPVGDEDEDLEQDARLGWDHSAEPVSDGLFPKSFKMLTFVEPIHPAHEPSRRETICATRRGASRNVLLPSTNAEALRCQRAGTVPGLICLKCATNIILLFARSVLLNLSW